MLNKDNLAGLVTSPNGTSLILGSASISIVSLKIPNLAAFACIIQQVPIPHPNIRPLSESIEIGKISFTL